MKGVVPLGNEKIEVREIPDPKPGPGEVVVKVKTAGVCGSDLHAYRKTWEEIGERQGLVIGHEASGIVAEIGTGVSEDLIGQRVSVYHYRGCGFCQHCLRGNYMLCEKKRAYGWHVHGADAELLLTDARNCCIIPESLSYEDGSIIACAAGTAYSAIRKLGIIEGEGYFAVLGLGPVGLSAALLAQGQGWKTIGIDTKEDRTNYAKEIGITAMDGSSFQNLSESLRSISGNETVLRVFDSTGSEAGLEAALRLTAPEGGIVTVGKGMWPLRFLQTIDVADLIRKQILFMGSWVYPISYYWDIVTALTTNDIHLDRMITGRFPLEKAQEAFEFANNPKNVGKAVLVMD